MIGETPAHSEFASADGTPGLFAPDVPAL